MAKKFTKNIENFACERCGKSVKGSGFTNHCPNCLYSRHVDINPGDRMENCKGMMKPIALEIDHGKYVIIHQCEKCGFKKKNKATPNDNFELMLKLIKNPGL